MFRYCDSAGSLSGTANPNGAINDIAGILNERGNVMGMMPHPENLVEPIQGGTDGRGIFDSIVRATATAMA